MKKDRSPRTSTEVAALVTFRRWVCEKAAEVDHDDSMDWYAMSVGFFMGQGIKADRAHELASYVRYDCLYWNADRRGADQLGN